MRRIDEVKNKTMYGVRHVKVLGKDRIRITFRNNECIELTAKPEDFVGDCGIYITVDNLEQRQKATAKKEVTS